MAAPSQSAWATHPGYRIDVVPLEGRVRVWCGDVMVAESTRAVRVLETDHVERIYLPLDDTRQDLLVANDHHTVCPFKGEADYWSVEGGGQQVEDLFWTYRDPYPQVAAIKDLLGVYHEKARVEVEPAG